MVLAEPAFGFDFVLFFPRDIAIVEDAFPGKNVEWRWQGRGKDEVEGWIKDDAHLRIAYLRTGRDY